MSNKDELTRTYWARIRLLRRWDDVAEKILAADGRDDPLALRHTLAAMHHGWPLALHHELLAWEDALRAYQAERAELAAGEREPLVLAAKEAPWDRRERRFDPPQGFEARRPGGGPPVQRDGAAQVLTQKPGESHGQ